MEGTDKVYFPVKSPMFARMLVEKGYRIVSLVETDNEGAPDFMFDMTKDQFESELKEFRKLKKN